MSKEKDRIHAILHTHWDREWYFTDTEAQVLFIYHIDEVIDELQKGTIDYYLLDGQMSIVDDYLTMFPQKIETVKKLVQNGKLAVGPWYIQMDEFLASGESCQRNLEIGAALGNALGGVMKVGYLPDSFGQCKDLPKLLNGFGIDTFVFWRGLYNPGGYREFIWAAEDGSKLLCSNIIHGYFEGRDLIEKDDRQDDIAVLSRNRKESRGRNTLLPVGFDQRPVYRNLRDKLKTVNQAIEENVIESSLPAYFKALKEEGHDFAQLKGEFLNATVSKIHRSIYSSRYDIKQMNDILERKLTYVLEPLMTMADARGLEYKRRLLDTIWKLVIKNQAHDSLGACNSDKTNQNIESRGKQALELTQSAIDYILRKMAISSECLDENDLLICNPLPYGVTEPVSADITTASENFRIVDTQGNDVAFQMQSQSRECDAPVKRDMSVYSEANYYYHTEILMQAELGPMEFKRFRIVENGETIPQDMDIKNAACQNVDSNSCNFIENRYYKIESLGEVLRLIRKKDNKVIEDFLILTDDGDDGDNYDYSPACKDVCYTLDYKNAAVTVRKGSVAQTLIIEGTWMVPADQEKRTEDICDRAIPYQLKLTLTKDSKRADVQLDIDNKAIDHRMRCHIKNFCGTDASFAGTQYGEVERPNEDPHLADWRQLGWREEPTSIYPLLNYVNIHDSEEGLTVFSRGIKEYQVTGQNYDRISLTLFRSVGYLGKPDLFRRPGDASGTKCRLIETPDSQMQKKLHFEYAFQYEEEYTALSAWKSYISYAADYPSYHKQDRNKFVTPMGYFKINDLGYDVDLMQPFRYQLDMSEGNMVFCSMRKICDNTVELRLFNPDLNREIHEESLEFSDKVCYYLSDLQGNPITEMKEERKIVLRNIKPGQIVTIHFVQ